MSDERDETRRFSPFDDATWADDPAQSGWRRSADRPPPSSRTPDDTVQQPGFEDGTGPQPKSEDGTGPDDATVHPAGSTDGPGPEPARLGDATRVQPSGSGTTGPPPPTGEDVTRVQASAADDALPGTARTESDHTGPQAHADAPTLVDGPARSRPDNTAVMPAAEDNPAWSGRAEVRPPQPGPASYQREVDWPAGPGSERRDRWWMPIVVGIIVLVLLAALGWGVYLIFKNAAKNDSTPAPAATTTAPPAPSTAATTQTTEPSSAPTPTTPASTTEPTNNAIAIPALRGLTVADAKAALHGVGIDSTRVIYRPAPAQPDTVVDSDPAEGQEVPPDTTVTLVVAAPATATGTATATGAANGN